MWTLYGHFLSIRSQDLTCFDIFAQYIPMKMMICMSWCFVVQSGLELFITVAAPERLQVRDLISSCGWEKGHLRGQPLAPKWHKSVLIQKWGSWLWNAAHFHLNWVKICSKWFQNLPKLRVKWTSNVNPDFGMLLHFHTQVMLILSHEKKCKSSFITIIWQISILQLLCYTWTPTRSD